MYSKLMRRPVAGHIVAAIIKKFGNRVGMGRGDQLLAQRLVGGMQAHRQGELIATRRSVARPASFGIWPATPTVLTVIWRWAMPRSLQRQLMASSTASVLRTPPSQES